LGLVKGFGIEGAEVGCPCPRPIITGSAVGMPLEMANIPSAICFSLRTKTSAEFGYPLFQDGIAYPGFKLRKKYNRSSGSRVSNLRF